MTEFSEANVLRTMSSYLASERSLVAAVRSNDKKKRDKIDTTVSIPRKLEVKY